MDLGLLKEATRKEHEATEEMMPLMDSDLSRDEYVRVLQALHRLITAWDAWSVTHAPADLRGLMRGRQRGELLEDDLHWLGAEPGANDIPLSEFVKHCERGAQQRAAFLGAMYVVEGSTLGGQFIAAHVEAVLGLQGGRGNAYFRGYGAETGAKWKEFRKELAAVAEEHTPIVIGAAKNMFLVFSHVLRVGATA